MTYAYCAYGSVSTYYSWTGVNTENMVGSPITITEPARIKEIWIHGGGYGTTAYTFHCLWNSAGTLLTRSDTVTWPDGRDWRYGYIDYVVQPGTYWIGFWSNPAYRRQWSEGGSGNGVYRVTKTDAAGSLVGGAYSAKVMCAGVTYEPVGSMWVNAGSGPGTSGTWKKGKAWVNTSGTWRQSKGVWINTSGTWRLSK